MKKNLLKDSQGMALVVVMMTVMVMLSITSANLHFSGLDLKATSNLKTGSGAMHSADAGIQHALALESSATTFSYTTETTILSSFSFGNGYSYTVTAINDPASSGGNSQAIFTSTATGPNSSTRKARVYLGRSSVWIPPGAIYLAGQPQYIETTFNGGSFQISGNDTNPGEAVGSGSASPVPGLATTDSGTTDEISGASGSLSSSQYDQVTGEGSDPSVATSSTTIDVDQLANDFIALGVEGTDKQTLSGPMHNNVTWGTSSNPLITHITGNATIKGGSTGYGIIIVDGDLKTSGNLTFEGLIIARGNADIHGAGGPGESATIWGGLLIKESTSTDPKDELKIGGPAKIYYSSQVLNVLSSHWGSAYPTAAKIIAWNEAM